MSKLIVTGGAGFIGSHLVDALLERGHDVSVIDNFLTGKRERLNPKATLHETDIRDLEKLRPILNGADCVFHLAALPRVVPSIQDPQTSHDINVNGTFNVLLAARDAGVRRVIYSASSSAYGDQATLPLRETMPINPLSPYALQKYIGERMCQLFSRVYGLETVSLRYVNVYGPRYPSEGPYALVVGKFLEQRKKGVPLTIVPDGTQSRDFVHVRDVARAHLLAAVSSRVGKGEVINIAGGNNFSVLQIADLIGGEKLFVEPRLEPKHTLADISKASELLGWKPELSFEDGMKTILPYL